MTNRNSQAALITRTDVLDAIRGIAWAHVQTMRYVPASAESAAFSEGYYAALAALCAGFNLNEAQLPRLKSNGGD